MIVRLRIGLCVFLSLMGTIGPCFGQTNRLEERLRAEAPERWSSYLEFAKRLQGNMSLVIYDLTVGKEVLERQRGEYWQFSGHAVRILEWESQDPKAPWHGEAQGANDRYCFHLFRGPGSQWRIGVVNSARASSDCANEAMRIVQVETSFFLRVYPQVWLPDAMFSPRFRISAVTSVQRDAGELIRVDFEYDDAKPIKGASPLAGWLLLDPDNYWVLREYEAGSSSVLSSGKTHRGRTHVRFGFKKAASGHPVLTDSVVRMEVAYDDNEPHDIREVVTARDLREQETVPLKQFTLSGFGLPEPPASRFADAPSSKITNLPLYFWFGLAALLCLALGVVFRLCQRALKNGCS